MNSKALNKLWVNSKGRIRREAEDEALSKRYPQVKVNKFNVYLLDMMLQMAWIAFLK